MNNVAIEKAFFQTDEEKFVVHLTKVSKDEFRGEVYPIIVWTTPGTNITGWSYQSKKDCAPIDFGSDVFKQFDFIFCWRGTWEGRIYFPNNEEYWSSDLRVMADVWDKIEPILKDKINP